MSFFALQLILSGLLFYVIYSDIKEYRIANWLNGLIGLLFVPYAIFSDNVVYHEAIGVGFAFFLLGYFLFSFKLMGGGDVKLLAVCGLWTGLAFVGKFILLFAILNGVFAVIILALRRLAPSLYKKQAPPRILQPRQPLAFGVGIALAMLWLIWQDGIIK